MSDIASRSRAAFHSRAQVSVLAVAAVGLLTVTIRTANSLYFVWEEWGHLWDAVESPFWGLLQSHFGYVIPLGRLLFLIEAKIFGHWYVGYAVVNAALLIAVVVLMWRTLRPANSWASWALTGGLVTFLFSGGSLFAVNFAAMNSYFLCWLFGLCALVAWRAHRHPIVVLGLFVCAALSNSLMNVVVTAFVASMMVGLGRSDTPAAWRWNTWRVPLGYALFAAAVSVLLYFIGRAFPSVDPLVGVNQSIASTVEADPIGQIIPLGSFIAVWLISPFIAVIAVSQDLYERSVILLIDRPVLLVVVLVALVALLSVAAARRFGGVGWRRGLPTVVLLTSALAFAAQIVLFRGEQSFEVRYTLMWMPAVVVFWSWWVNDTLGPRIPSPISSTVTVLARITTAAMVLSALLVAALSPVLVDQAVDVMRPRTEVSLELKDAVLQCGVIEEPAVADVLAPGMPWEGVCEAASFLRD